MLFGYARIMVAAPLSLQPVPRRRSLADAVVAELSSAIVQGRIAPGEALPAEPALAALLGVKRGVLREGIKRLEQAGLVEPRQGGGTFVCDYRRRAGLDLLPVLLVRADGGFDPAVARSVMEMRSALAPDVARRAAARRSPAQRGEIEGAAAALAAAAPEDRTGAPLQTFWNALVDASGNVAYRLAYNALLAVADLGGAPLRRLLAVETEPLDDYAALAAAVADGDGARAAELAAGIVRRGEAAVGRVLAAREEAP